MVRQNKVDCVVGTAIEQTTGSLVLPPWSVLQVKGALPTRTHRGTKNLTQHDRPLNFRKSLQAL